MEKHKEVVINTCFGGFGLSDEAYERLITLGIPHKEYSEEDNHSGKKVIYSGGIGFQKYWDTWLDDEREYPLLIKVVKELKDKANGQCARLKIIKIPADVDYEISEYDGSEHIAEKHRTWA